MIVNSDVDFPKDYINNLPPEILLRVFGYLDFKSLTTAARVCKEWLIWANDAMEQKAPSFFSSIFDGKVWNMYLPLEQFKLSVAEEKRPCNRELFQAAKKLISSREINRNAGITLLTIPQNLSLRKLEKIIANLKMGNQPSFAYIRDAIKKYYWDRTTDKTYVVAITNDIFRDSANLTFDKQKALIKEMAIDLPELLPMCVLAFLTYITMMENGLPKRLLEQASTRTAELEGGLIPFVGHFTSLTGLVVNHLGKKENTAIGIAGMVKFPVE